jgi:hypothetical protein
MPRYLAGPAALAARYAGHPKVSVTKMPHAAASGVSSAMDAQSERAADAKTSSCSTEHVFLWCFACEMRHEWYGTSSAECSTQPTVSLSACEGEKDWWPHSCASTHTPVAMVPCTAQYASHSSGCAAAGAARIQPAP